MKRKNTPVWVKILLVLSCIILTPALFLLTITLFACAFVCLTITALNFFHVEVSLIIEQLLFIETLPKAYTIVGSVLAVAFAVISYQLMGAYLSFCGRKIRNSDRQEEYENDLADYDYDEEYATAEEEYGTDSAAVIHPTVAGTAVADPVSPESVGSGFAVPASASTASAIDPDKPGSVQIPSEPVSIPAQTTDQAHPQSTVIPPAEVPVPSTAGSAGEITATLTPSPAEIRTVEKQDSQHFQVNIPAGETANDPEKQASTISNPQPAPTIAEDAASVTPVHTDSAVESESEPEPQKILSAKETPTQQPRQHP